ncbi:hypothetical protein PsorP6_017484 [Peronosclerospora sorghi]|uniref:Uncharacterized protein n=1 Tax=Peronosclerospora sorghi TaxID=230839 RepID=A0ACC0WKZ4_9STRA|nr:hypothetical protein PsorP6_017484 [Peronosclerospora sorghi]
MFLLTTFRPAFISGTLLCSTCHQTPSKLQPCDTGIIRNLKAYYRRSFNRLLLQRVEDKLPDPEKIDILEAIKIAVPAWKNEVKAETIANCFRHCRIRSTAPEDQQPVLAEEELLDQEVVAELESQIRRFRYANPMDVLNLLYYSEEDVVTYAPTLDEVIQDHLVPEPMEEQADDDESQEVSIVPVSEAQAMIRSLETFWLQQSDVNELFMTALQRMKNKAAAIKTSQMKQRAYVTSLSVFE